MLQPRFDLKGDIGVGGVTCDALTQFLAKHPDGATIFINSPGGNAVEGAAMMAEIERHGRVTVHVQGIAASAATLPVVAAKTAIIHPAAVLMIHEPSSFAGGTADEHREMAGALDKLSRTYAEAYSRHTGQPLKRIESWMKSETWLTADEAVVLGFCDQVEATTAEVIQASAFDYSRFRSAPSEFLNLLNSRGDAGNAPTTKA